FGVSPVELAQTQRLLLAKRLLTDTALPITEIAFASGFSSLRRFNALFQERYRMNPSTLRKGQAAEVPPQTLECELAYRPPLDWDTMLGFLGARATRGVESVEGQRYLRTASFGRARGWLVVEPSRRRHTLRVTLSASLAPAIRPTLACVKRLFDLAASPDAIAARLGSIVKQPGLRVPGAWDGFEMAVRAVLGQQVSVRAATMLSGRFAAALGEPIETPFDSLTHLSPSAEHVAAATVEEVIALGIITSRARAIVMLAQAVAEGQLALEPGVHVPATLEQLQALPGIGTWTEQIIAMRALAWPDAFPHTDLGIRKALGEPDAKRVLERAEAWRPWRAYAAIHLWHSLEGSS
ncbi:MAG: helix-turn-helix domain-containing protein, partial [Chloroflexota bacterium]|nr:helix-turn-helix domain-containing protein [Chloroflexota bacterium]